MPAILAIVVRYLVYLGAMAVGAAVTTLGSVVYDWYAKRKKARELAKRMRVRKDSL